MNIGERLYNLRKEKNISQEEVAEKLNVSRQTISKWETNQSQPDFDKIIPICELYEITTEELFGNIKNIDVKTKMTNKDVNVRIKTAKIVSISVLLYFIAVIWIILGASIVKDELLISVFLLICAIATVLLTYHFLSIPTIEESKDKKSKEEIEKYDGLIAIFFTCIYLFISFITRAWSITWLVWIVFALVIEIVHLLLGIKGNDDEK